MDSNNNKNAKAKSQKNNHPSSLPSPRHSHSHSSSSSSSCSNNNNNNTPPLPVTPTTPYPPKPITRSDSGNPYPTTFVQADPSNFKQVVQMLTGSPETVRKAAEPLAARNHHHIPPIKTIPRKPNQPQSGFKLYERRNSLKNLNLNPLLPVFSPKPTPTTGGGFFPSPRNHHHHPEILSPSILDFPALVLSPVTPLIPDPFNRSAVVTGNNNNYGCGNGNGRMNDMNSPKMSTEAAEGVAAAEEEERAIREKGFYLHPSPRATTPRDAEPRLLPLFPTTSPTASSAPSTPPPPPSN